MVLVTEVGVCVENESHDEVEQILERKCKCSMQLTKKEKIRKKPEVKGQRG